MNSQIKKTKLVNGTRVILVPRTETEAVLVQVMYAVGSRHEPPEQNGIAHFLEHMMFKGTARRPGVTDIDRELDAVGAESNASTDKECTSYFIKLRADKLGLAIDILADMLHHPLFNDAAIAIERGAVIEEIHGCDDDSNCRADDLLDASSYPSSTLGRPILGTVETVTALTRQDLVDFHRLHYVPVNMVIAVAGRFDESEALGLLESSFGGTAATASDSVRDRPARSDPVSDGPRVALNTMDHAEQAVIRIGFETDGYADPRQPALEVLTNLLGGMMSSRLFVKIRTENGLAYSVGAYDGQRSDIGQLVICAGLAKEHLEMAIGLIIEELIKIKTDGITEEELQLAKDNLRGSYALSFDSSRHVVHFYGLRELFAPQSGTIQEFLDRLAAVTAEEVQQAARDLFRASKLCLAIDSPEQDQAPHLALAAKLGE